MDRKFINKYQSKKPQLGSEVLAFLPKLTYLATIKRLIPNILLTN